MLIMIRPATRVAFASLVVSSVPAIVTSCAQETAPLPAANRVEVYEALRGSPTESQGYLFTISPDEAWIAVQGLDADGEVLVLLHRPTQRSWRTALSPSQGLTQWYPNCFSRDGATLYLEHLSAALSPEMTALDLRPAARPPDLARFEGTFLNFPGRLKQRSGKTAREWLDTEDQVYGEYTWSADGTTLYEALVEGQLPFSFLRTTPPGAEAAIDYAAVFAAARSRMSSTTAEIRRNMPKADTLSAEQRKGLDALLKIFEVEESTFKIRLDQLSVSPDRRFLAAVATLYPGQVGFAGRPYGVLIPTDRGGLAAYPFAENVYGKAIWSKDGSAIYYYAQPTAGGGHGTVHRLPVSAVKIPARIRETPLSAEKRSAPTDEEIELARYEKTKDAHYRSLQETFARAQSIKDFQAALGYTASGYEIRLFGTSSRSWEQIDSYAASHLLGRLLEMRLPDREDFMREYIPGVRHGFHDSSKYPRLDGAGSPFGTVPVLIYEDQRLVNSRFEGGSASLPKYEKGSKVAAPSGKAP